MIDLAKKPDNQKKMINLNPNSLFSIILVNYNYEKYIGEAIDSVLSQTCSDFELIIVDDGSTDESRNIINKYEDSRIIKIFKENGGQASGFNAGFAQATGRYVAFMDSDDLFDRDKLERVHAVFLEKDYALVQHQHRVINENSKVLDQLFPPLKLGEQDILKLYSEEFKTDFFSSTTGITSPRRILRNIFPISESDWRICADGALSRPLPIFGLTYTLNSPAGSYRIHGENNWMNTEKRKENIAQVQRELINYTNKFLKRWNKDFQIQVTLPIELLKKKSITSFYLFGLDTYTQQLLSSDLLCENYKVLGIIDDHVDVKTYEGIPVISSKKLQTELVKSTVIISNKVHEKLFTERALGLKFENIILCDDALGWKLKFKSTFEDLNETLSLHGRKKIALYGIGYHTVRILTSEIFKTNCEVTAIFDETNHGYTLLGIPVYHPEDASKADFDAVVISSELRESQLFPRALTFFSEAVYLIYGPVRTLKGNRSDHEDIRRFFVNKKENKVGIYGASYFTQMLLQSKNLINVIDVKCVLDDITKVTEIYGVPVCQTDKDSMPEIDTVIVPPGFYTNDLEKKLKNLKADVFKISTNVDDIKLVSDFLINSPIDPIILDVGANLGTSFRPFALKGWQVYAFEPESYMKNNLISQYSGMSNVSIIGKAISNEEKKDIPLFKSDVSGGITTLSVFHYSHYFAEYVESIRLSTFLAEKKISEADFLKIDTEGYDYFVLQGNNWKEFRPRIVMCEYEDRKTIPLGYTGSEMIKYLSDQGYHILISELYPVCEYGNQQRWRGFVEYPSQLFDGESCGNVLAFENMTDYSAFVSGLDVNPDEIKTDAFLHNETQ